MCFAIVSSGIGFLPVHLGSTLMAAPWRLVMRKIVRISKARRIPSIALQLKGISGGCTIVQHDPAIVMLAKAGAVPFLGDSALYVAALLATFTVLFGTRHLDATERHEGLVAAIAFESIVKLVAFLAVDDHGRRRRPSTPAPRTTVPIPSTTRDEVTLRDGQGTALPWTGGVPVRATSRSFETAWNRPRSAEPGCEPGGPGYRIPCCRTWKVV